jgi:hypothetical protein
LDKNPDPKSENVGYASDAVDLSFLRFDPDFNKSPPSTAQPPAKPPAARTTVDLKTVLGKFPLEIPTPIHSPKVGLKRFGSFRFLEVFFIFIYLDSFILFCLIFSFF